MVDGDFDDVPEIAQARDRVLLIQHLAFDDLGTVESFETVWPMDAARLVTINGQVAPTITMRPGEVQRWRLIQGGFHDYHRWRWTSTCSTRSPPMGSFARACARRSSCCSCPGQRSDVLVQAGAPGRTRCAACPTIRS